MATKTVAAKAVNDAPSLNLNSMFEIPPRAHATAATQTESSAAESTEERIHGEPIRNIVLMPNSRIKPKNNPRKYHDAKEHGALVANIKSAIERGRGIPDAAGNGTGIYTPIMVRLAIDEDGNEYYEIIAGGRRWHAHVEAGGDLIPVIVYDQEDVDAWETALVENFLQLPMRASDIAAALQKWMLEADISLREIARRTGKSAADLSHSFGVVRDPVLLSAVESGRITPSQAREMTKIPNEKKQAAVDTLADLRENKVSTPLPALREALKSEDPAAALRNIEQSPTRPGTTQLAVRVMSAAQLYGEYQKVTAFLETLRMETERAKRKNGIFGAGFINNITAESRLIRQKADEVDELVQSGDE